MLKNIQKTRRVLLVVFAVIVCAYSTVTSSTAPTPSAIPAISSISPDKAIENLKEGNERFLSGKSTHPRIDAAQLAQTSKNGQHPFATVLTCSDSRLPAELIFDQGIGDIFVIRVAGNVCKTDEAGSIEYGTGHLNTPLLVILGHTGCGAVTAVTTEAKLGGNIAPLVANIKPAVEKAAAANPHLSQSELVPEAIKANCWQSIEDLFKTSPEVCELVKAGKLKVVAAIYNISTGKVGWLGVHPDQNRLIALSCESSEKKVVASQMPVHNSDSQKRESSSDGHH